MRPIQRVAIIGGSGFVGMRFAGLLSAAGLDFRVGDIRPPADFSSSWFPCDVRDKSSLSDFLRGSDVIVNLAAEHRDDVRPLSRYDDVNVKGAANVCEVASELGIAKIIFTSSVAVYGFSTDSLDENGPFAPFNAYGKTKLEAEGVFRNWAGEDSRGKTLVVIRPTVIFGEGNRGNVFNLLNQIASGRFVMVGSGANRKSMAYVGNVAAFLVHALSFDPGLHIMNYVDGPDLSTKEIVSWARRCLGRSAQTPTIPKPIAMAGGRVLDLVARLSGRTFPISAIRIEKFCASTQFKAERAMRTGFKPPFSLEEGLARTIENEFRSTSGVSAPVADAAE